MSFLENLFLFVRALRGSVGRIAKLASIGRVAMTTGLGLRVTTACDSSCSSSSCKTTDALIPKL